MGVDEEDRDALCFLWVNEPYLDQPEVVVKMFTRLVFGISSSPFLLNATLRYQMDKYAVSDPQFVKQFLEALYVDDLATGGQTIKETYQLFLKSKLRMLEAGYNIRKWSSNSKELIEKIKTSDYNDKAKCNEELHEFVEDDGTHASVTLGTKHEVNEERKHKVQGITWNHDTDEQSVDLNRIANASASLPATKRTVLKGTAQVYDPLGWISPIIIEMKVLFQKISESKVDWDDELTQDLKKSYDKWVLDLQRVGKIKIQRCYFNQDNPVPVSIQLHGFSDASSYAYAAAVYLRIELQSGVRTILVASKTRVAPLGGQTIPTLQLLGAVILGRLMKHITATLSQSKKIDTFIVRPIQSVSNRSGLPHPTSQERQQFQLILRQTITSSEN